MNGQRLLNFSCFRAAARDSRPHVTESSQQHPSTVVGLHSRAHTYGQSQPPTDSNVTAQMIPIQVDSSLAPWKGSPFGTSICPAQTSPTFLTQRAHSLAIRVRYAPRKRFRKPAV